MSDIILTSTNVDVTINETSIGVTVTDTNVTVISTAITDGIADAASDGKVYSRQNASWVDTGINIVADCVALGDRALASNADGYLNVAVGAESLSANTDGYLNVALGDYALTSSTTGNFNMAVGAVALYANTEGCYNAAIGNGSLQNNITGNGNTANGYQSLFSNTSGDFNVSFGYNSLFGLTTGNKNSAFGYNAGLYIADGSNNETSSESVYIGDNTRASANGNTNETVIGHETVGNGSNTITYGNDSITKHVFTGGDIEVPNGIVIGKKIGVHAYLSASTDVTVITAGTFYPIGGAFTNDISEGFVTATENPPGIKYDCNEVIYFEIDWHATIATDIDRTTVTPGVKKNNVLIPGSDKMPKYCHYDDESYSFSGTAVVELEQGDEIQLVLTADGDGDVVTVVGFITTIRKFF